MSVSSRVQQVVDHIVPPNAANMSVGKHPMSTDLPRGLVGPEPETIRPETWEKVPLAPPDSIFKLTAAFKTDTFPRKVNLGVGAYRDDNSKPWVLPVVKKASTRVTCLQSRGVIDSGPFGHQATRILLDDPALDHEYLPITGLPEFTSAAARLILGENSPVIAENRVCSVQTISGTGANHLGALFLSRFYEFNGTKQVYLSDPTWGMSEFPSRTVVYPSCLILQ